VREEFLKEKDALLSHYALTAFPPFEFSKKHQSSLGKRSNGILKSEVLFVEENNSPSRLGADRFVKTGRT